MEQELYEISFIGKEALYQFCTRMDHATSEQLQKAIYNDTNRQEVSDVQVYRISEEKNETSAIEMVEIMEDNTYDDDCVLPALRKLADKVDVAVGKPGAEKEILLVEFVWDNGGGDDNAFAQNVCVNKRARKTNKAFFYALKNYLNGISYDYSVTSIAGTKEREIPFYEAIQTALDVLIDLEQPVKLLTVIRDAIELDERTPESPRTRTGPRL